MKQIVLAKPDDWHLHLRQGDEMRSIVDMTARQMGRAIVMPNLSSPVRTVEQAVAYRKEIVGKLSDKTSLLIIPLSKT